MVLQMDNVQNEAQVVAMSEGRYGGYNTTAESSVDQFAQQQKLERDQVTVIMFLTTKEKMNLQPLIAGACDSGGVLLELLNITDTKMALAAHRKKRRAHG